MADEVLASFVSDFSRTDPPGSVANRASLVAVDTVGAVLGDASDPTIATLTRRQADRNGGESTVMGTAGERTTVHRAAFANMAAGSVLELDEGHRFAAGHPTTHVLPMLLTDGKSTHRSDGEFLTASVAGHGAVIHAIETVVSLADGLYPHGVWSGVGVAAAVARSRGLDAEMTLDAMQTAADYAQRTRLEVATEGAIVRNGCVGMSNLSGLLAIDQAESGFTDLDDDVARHLEPVAMDDPDRDALTDGLGEHREIERGYFKIHAARRYTYVVLNAAAFLVEEMGVDTVDVDAITVETYPVAVTLSEPASQNVLQAKSSVPFVVASALMTGETDKEAFTDEVLTKTALGFVRRVDVVATEGFAAHALDERGACITVETTDSERYARGVHAARDGEHDPVTESELRVKLDRFVASVIGDGGVDGLQTAATEPAAPRVLYTLTRAWASRHSLRPLRPLKP